MAVRVLKTIEALESAGLVTEDESRALQPVEAHYAISVTPHVQSLIDPSNANDPVRRMFVPSTEEMLRTEVELNDPIGDDAHSPLPGLVHRYPNRVLLKPVPVCPVYCRFCFRREMVGPELGASMKRKELDAALAYIAANPEIREVILTGGDPFMMSEGKVRELTEAISAIEHVDIIRWHTRMPVADPEKITDGFVAALKSKSKAVFVSIHINHLQELSPETKTAFARMVDVGIPMISQSVLLRGVNDSAETLAELMQALLAARVKPYYLHHPDLAPGTGHFRMSIEEGQAVYAELRNRVSGMAVPQYVIDIPGGVSKANAALSDVFGEVPSVELLGRDGKRHSHPG